MGFWTRRKENSEEELENGAKEVNDSAQDIDRTDTSEADREDKTTLSPKYSYAQAGEHGISKPETGKYAEDIQTLRGLQGMYESKTRMHDIEEEKKKTPWRERKKRKALTQMTKEEKENLRIAKKLAAKHLRKEGHKKVLAKYEKGMGTVGSIASRATSGFQKQVIEGKGGVTVRGGTIYPKTKQKYTKRYKKPYSKRTKSKKSKRKSYRTKRTKEKRDMPLFSGFLSGGSNKGKKPPLFFDPWG